MSSCTSTPTSTAFTTIVSSSVSTTFSESTTTLSDSTSTSLITSCLDSASASAAASGGASCLSSTVIASTTVISGGVSTTQIPVEATVFQTQTEAVQTFFATSCSSTDGSTTPVSSPTSSTTTSLTSSSSILTTSTSVTTPTTTFLTSVSTTLPNGSVTEALTTVTSVLPASSIVVTTSVPQPATQQSNGSSGGSGSNTGAIVGGAVGGAVGLIALVAALWFYCRRRRNWDDVFEKDYDEFADAQAVKHGRFGRGNLLDAEDDPIPPPPIANNEPTPYVYGLVGSRQATSPPSMNAGLQDTASFGERPRTLSETPLMNNAVPSAASSRPTSFAAGSNSGHGHGPEAGGASPASGRRSASPGPLGALIDAGPSLSLAMAGSGQPVSDSPTSPSHPRKLFVANQDPGSPTSPAWSEMKRQSLNNGPGTSSFAGAMSGVAAPPTSYPPEKESQGVERSNTASSRSVYSQASSPQSPVIVHKDAGPVQPIPPQYRD